jgi:hypothetical protein
MRRASAEGGSSATVASPWVSTPNTASTMASWARRGDVTYGGSCTLVDPSADTAGGGVPTSDAPSPNEMAADGRSRTMSEAAISSSIGSTQAGGRTQMPRSSASGSGGTSSERSHAAEKSMTGVQPSRPTDASRPAGSLRRRHSRHRRLGVPSATPRMAPSEPTQGAGLLRRRFCRRGRLLAPSAVHRIAPSKPSWVTDWEASGLHPQAGC